MMSLSTSSSLSPTPDQILRMCQSIRDQLAVSPYEELANQLTNHVRDIDEHLDSLWQEAMDEDDEQLASSLSRLEIVRGDKVYRRFRLRHAIQLIDGAGCLLLRIGKSAAEGRDISRRFIKRRLNFRDMLVAALATALFAIIGTSLTGRGPLKFHYENVIGPPSSATVEGGVVAQADETLYASAHEQQFRRASAFAMEGAFPEERRPQIKPRHRSRLSATTRGDASGISDHCCVADMAVSNVPEGDQDIIYLASGVGSYDPRAHDYMENVRYLTLIAVTFPDLNHEEDTRLAP